MQKMINRYAPLIKMISENIEKKANSALQKYGITNVQMQVLIQCMEFRQIKTIFSKKENTLSLYIPVLGSDS